MKLNHECVRDIVIALESLEINEILTSSNFSEHEILQKYDLDEVFYTVEKLDEAGFINVSIAKMSGGINFKAKSLTWYGHQFIDNIRDDTIWKKTKQKAGKVVSSVSLPVLSELASSVLKNSLGLN